MATRQRVPTSEKHKKRLERNRRYRARLVGLGDQKDSWNELKTVHGFETDRDFAKYLLDSIALR